MRKPKKTNKRKAQTAIRARQTTTPPETSPKWVDPIDMESIPDLTLAELSGWEGSDYQKQAIYINRMTEQTFLITVKSEYADMVKDYIAELRVYIDVKSGMLRPSEPSEGAQRLPANLEDHLLFIEISPIETGGITPPSVMRFIIDPSIPNRATNPATGREANVIHRYPMPNYVEVEVTLMATPTASGMDSVLKGTIRQTSGKVVPIEASSIPGPGVKATYNVKSENGSSTNFEMDIDGFSPDNFYKVAGNAGDYKVIFR